VKLFIFFLLFSISLSAIEHKSELNIKHINYDKFSTETTFQGDTKLRVENEFFTADASLEYLYSDKYKERRYIKLNELFISKEYDDYSFSFGKMIKYWGELEGFNLADIYNQKNYLLDPFDKGAKLGSLGLNITRYFDDNSLEFGVKFYEENLNYPSPNDPYYPFPIDYINELSLSHERYTPTIHLAYSFISEESFDSESKLIFLHGYDNKRYFAPINQTTLSQHAYRVNKLIFLSHIIYGDTIFKCEMSYTDVVSDKKMSDYAQLSVGAEKSFYDVVSVDMSLYLEYYRYLYMQDGKIERVDISEIYDNDIFTALKIDFTDVRSSEIKVGLLYDIKKQERVFKIQAKSRVVESFVVSGEFLQIISKEDTLFSNLGDSRRVVLGLSYTF